MPEFADLLDEHGRQLLAQLLSMARTRRAEGIQPGQRFHERVGRSDRWLRCRRGISRGRGRRRRPDLPLQRRFCVDAAAGLAAGGAQGIPVCRGLARRPGRPFRRSPRRRPTGTRPVADSDARLFSSSPDGSQWTLVSSFAGKEVGVDTGVAPVPKLAASCGSSADPMTTRRRRRSGPRQTWRSGPPSGFRSRRPRPAARSRRSRATTDGYVAVGEVSAPDGTSVHSSWLSADGISWTELPTPGTTGDDGPDVLADGPAGPIGFELYNGSEVPPGVWALRGP